MYLGIGQFCEKLSYDTVDYFDVFYKQVITTHRVGQMQFPRAPDQQYAP